MRKLPALLVVFLVMGIAGNVSAHEVTEEWAKELLHNWTDDLENGCEAATTGLAGLDAEELKDLRAMLVADMDSGEGKIMRRNYGPAGRYAVKMLNAIDDLLGQLPYERVVRGELVDNDELALQITFYDIKTLDGEIIKNVKVGDHTLMPACGFREKTEVVYDLYLRKNAVLKIDLVEHGLHAHH